MPHLANENLQEIKQRKGRYMITKAIGSNHFEHLTFLSLSIFVCQLHSVDEITPDNIGQHILRSCWTYH